jgi:hypothetical protein
MAEGIPRIQAGQTPVTDFLDRTENRPGIDDRNIRFVYVSRNNQLKVSSNWFTHILRMPFKTQGLAALQASVQREFGGLALPMEADDRAEAALMNIGQFRSQFRSLIKQCFAEPIVDDPLYEPDNDPQARIWNNFNREKLRESPLASFPEDRSPSVSSAGSAAVERHPDWNPYESVQSEKKEQFGSVNVNDLQRQLADQDAKLLKEEREPGKS